MRFIRSALTLALLISGVGTSAAGDVEIVEAKANANGNGTYTFDVTVKHGDTGWDHYANAWDVVAEDGTVLGTRTLYHPHVNEQPFTRSLAGVSIPKGAKFVTIRAYDSVHGLSDATFKLDLAADEPKPVKRKKKKARGSH